jgi:ADP-ribose pyrophosphatase
VSADQPGHSSVSRWTGAVCDVPAEVIVERRINRFRGRVWNVTTDVAQIGDQTVERDFVAHTGAVAVIAVDDADRVYLLRQYRHPVGMYLFEPPAGLLDVADEDPWVTAARELAEEAGLEARTWNVLVDFFNSPGGSSEAIRVYLARDVSERAEGRIETGEAEEVDLPGVWVPLDDAVGYVMAGVIGNPTSVVGILAAQQARRNGWTGLRSVDERWAVREQLVASGRVRLDVGPHH